MSDPHTVNTGDAQASKAPMRLRPLLAATLGAVALVATAVPAYALRQGARAPEIGLQDLQGRQVALADLRNKVVLVDFWASWCAPCREELPVLEELYQRYKDQGLVVVGVNVDDDVANARRFLRRTPVSFPVVHDAQKAVARRYGPTTMPSSYVIDQRGVVRHVHEGFRSGDAERMEREIQALLGSQARPGPASGRPARR